ncbi:MAG TPA: L-seryl-tRNA(Sec) selenium transferase [Terriglobia bacterium]|nr:L-seryl-tRNA(Sec) selenium transferase [Terriglobia bacterium]
MYTLARTSGERGLPFAPPMVNCGFPMSAPDITSLLRRIPSVDELLGREAVAAVAERLGRRAATEAARRVLDDWRERVTRGLATDLSPDALEQKIVAAAEASAQPSLRPVINATGVILHTNLGRAPLPPEAIEQVAEVAGHYSNLEYNLDHGERGKRDAHTDRLFAQLLGTEATLVVNNNAAAVFLALNTLAEGGEVIVSRGELIEIGGSFRIPDICSKSGATLREVGTTNRTRIADYAAAVTERTRVLLRVHPSNFRVVGFTERPSLEELVALGRERNVLMMEDLGSGCLVDLAPLGLRDEPPAGRSLSAGADVVTFSGDKLLGGPQAGILVGKREPLGRIRKNPLFRALRVDKLTIAALEATVSLYLRGDLNSIPALRMMRASKDAIAARAARLGEQLARIPGISCVLEDGESVAGGGSTPGQSLPTKVIAVTHASYSAEALAGLLRQSSPPVIVRVERERVLLDLRTVFENQEQEIVTALEKLVARGGHD